MLATVNVILGSRIIQAVKQITRRRSYKGQVTMAYGVSFVQGQTVSVSMKVLLYELPKMLCFKAHTSMIS
jgi:hypothetical protein